MSSNRHIRHMMIMPGLIPYSDFEKAIEVGQVKYFEKLKIYLERNSLDDIHAAMSWWACFKDYSKSTSSSSSMADDYFSNYYGEPTG